MSPDEGYLAETLCISNKIIILTMGERKAIYVEFIGEFILIIFDTLQARATLKRWQDKMLQNLY